MPIPDGTRLAAADPRYDALVVRCRHLLVDLDDLDAVLGVIPRDEPEVMSLVGLAAVIRDMVEQFKYQAERPGEVGL
jgi:hypothetical protein